MVSLIIGCCLAVSGVILQALLRNALASPFILGLSSGAGLGVMSAMYIGYVTGSSALRSGDNTFPALLGALITLGIVYSLGRRRGILDPLSLVVAATGTGKTMIAAFDYRRWSSSRRPSLLFIAHREEILKQALGTYRAVLRICMCYRNSKTQAGTPHVAGAGS